MTSVRNTSARAVALALVVMMAGAAFAAEPTTVMKPKRVVTSTIKAQAIVEAVVAETREVKLIGADNRRFSVIADTQVKNFDQIKPRDRVNVEYLESVAVTVLPAGAAAAPTSVTAVEVAPKGAKPAIGSVDVTELTATVASIDHDGRTATLSMPDGEARTVKVAEDVQLDKVDVGDRVRVTTTRAIAISVTPPAA